MYQYGKGVIQNYAAAVSWYEAAQKGMQMHRKTRKSQPKPKAKAKAAAKAAAAAAAAATAIAAINQTQ